MNIPEYEIVTVVDHDELKVCIKPPVDSAFRAEMYDTMDENLLKGIIVNGKVFFETIYLPSGISYSELKVSSLALKVSGISIIDLAQTSAEVLRNQNKKVNVSNYVKRVQSEYALFENI